MRMWVHTNNAFIAGYETLIAAYEAEHPDVDIQLENFDYELYLQTLQTAMPAGEEADILQLFGTWTSQYYERLAPVPADVMTIARAVPENRCLGVFWWDATWTAVPGNGWNPADPSAGNNWENQALFDFQSRPLPALNLFKKP